MVDDLSKGRRFAFLWQKEHTKQMVLTIFFKSDENTIIVSTHVESV